MDTLFYRDQTPFWVIDQYEQLAKCVGSPEAAATIVGALGDGAVVKSPNGKRLWREGHEKVRASENRQEAAKAIWRRLLMVWPEPAGP